MWKRGTLWLLVAGLLTGCPDDDETPDRGAADRGPTADGGSPDQGADAAPRDAGPDAARRDAAAPDAASPDAEPADAGPPGPPSPTEDQLPPRLFDPMAGPAVDGPLAALVDAWRTPPTDEASAQANAAQQAEAGRALAEAGPVAADRIVERCRPIPVQITSERLLCLRLLTLVESPGSIAWLLEQARLEVPPYPEGSHPIDPPPEGWCARWPPGPSVSGAGQARRPPSRRCGAWSPTPRTRPSAWP
ncbi:MAG: hypothetical protein R3F60_01855 [bacterium]